MPSAGRMNHIHVLVRDLPRAIRFYTEVFGLTEAYSDVEDGETLTFLHSEAGDVLTLHGRDSDEAGAPGGLQHFGFTIPAGDLAPALDTVKATGGEFLGYANWAGDESVAYVRDPDGYTVEIYARA